jgi:hypothetical protein
LTVKIAGAQAKENLAWNARVDDLASLVELYGFSGEKKRGHPICLLDSPRDFRKTAYLAMKGK